MSFTPVPLKILSPAQANPLAAAIQYGLRDYHQMQQNALARQKAQQAGIETGFLPDQLKALLQKQQAEGAQAGISTEFLPDKLKAIISQLQEQAKQAKKTTKYLPTKFKAEQLHEIAPSVLSFLNNKAAVASFPTLAQQLANLYGQYATRKTENLPETKEKFLGVFGGNNEKDTNYKTISDSDIAKKLSPHLVLLKNGQLAQI